MPTFNRQIPQTTDLAVPPLILASASPRRRELLERFWSGDSLTVLVPDFNESILTAAYLNSLGGQEQQAGCGVRPAAHELARLLPAGKLTALKNQFILPDPMIAITADTTVVLDDQVMGKPADQADAARMLRRLSGRTHEVLTGISLLARCQGEDLELQAVETTAVRFTEMTEAQIRWYIATGEPMDKAGAYGIQGYGAALVESIDGCYYNVMGLPVHRLMVMFQEVADHFNSFPMFRHLLPWY